MYVIKMNSDKSLMTTIRSTIYCGENNADTIKFLIPVNYEGANVADCDVSVEYVTPKGEIKTEVLELEPETYKNYYQYHLKVDSEFTAYPGNVKLSLEFRSKSIDFNFITGSIYVKIYSQYDENIPQDVAYECEAKVNALSEEVVKMESKVANIDSGKGQKSFQQVLDTESWESSNEAVKHYVIDHIAGANNGLFVEGTVTEDGRVIIPTGAFGKLSTMMNGKSQTVGGKSHAEGSKTIALENNSHAEGNETFAAGAHSHAEGNGSFVVGNAGHTEGMQSGVVGTGGHAEGFQTFSLGNYSHSEGILCESHGEGSHAEGQNCVSKGDSSHAEGKDTDANGVYSHSEGNESEANGDVSHAEGYTTQANGDSSHSEGRETVAEGENSHAEGCNTTSEGISSHSEGQNTSANGVGSHSEGIDTTATNEASHSEGYNSHATGNYSHAEGYSNEASGYASHAEGGRTKAKGAYNHSSGFETIANGDYQAVFGRANIEDKDRKYALIIGNGEINDDYTVDEEKRSNAHTVDWDGNAFYSGDITFTYENKQHNVGDLLRRIEELEKKLTNT